MKPFILVNYNPASAQMKPKRTFTEAIKRARNRVNMHRFGRQWKVYHWSEKHQATWESNTYDFYQAQAYQWEQRVAEALYCLGVEDAYAIANVEAYNTQGDRPDWRATVRRLYHKEMRKQT